MQLQRQKCLQAFAACVKGYNTKDVRVNSKLLHTYRVAALCERIAAGLGLADEEIDLAWLCGILHDVGRFEQLRRFDTFNGAHSVNHAILSVEILFEQGHIRDYLADPAEDALLRTAVALHSDYRLPETLDERTRLFCDILRDADKIDIFRMVVEGPRTALYGVTPEQLRQSPITPAVEQAFYEHHCVLNRLKKHPADHAVANTSLVYELVFPQSLRIAQEQGYLQQVLGIDTDNPDTAACLARMQAHLQQWLQTVQK